MDNSLVKPVRAALNVVEWPDAPRAYVPGKGFCIGASLCRTRVLCQIPRNEQEAALTRVDNELIRKSCHSSFLWSSLQFNKNTVAQPHKDKNNVGMSVIIIMGSTVVDA